MIKKERNKFDREMKKFSKAVKKIKELKEGPERVIETLKAFEYFQNATDSLSSQELKKWIARKEVFKFIKIMAEWSEKIENAVLDSMFEIKMYQ